MGETSSVPNFSSTTQFKAAYAAVVEEVCLVNAHTHALIASNKTGATEAPTNDQQNRWTLFSLIPAQVLAQFSPGFSQELVLTLPKKRALPVKLQVQEVQLQQEYQLMCVIHRTEEREAALEDLVAAADVEKKALLNEVYHRVKNNLNLILSLLSLQLNRIENPKMRRPLLESKSRIYTLALLQERLYASPRLSEINTREYLQKLIQAVVSSFRSPEQQLYIRHQIEADWANVDRLLPVGLIVHELVSNAVQHAFAGKKDGEVEVVLKEIAEGQCLLVVQDNGCGLPEPGIYTAKKGASLGVQLVTSLVRQLKGRLEVASSPESGTAVSIYFSKTT